MLKHLFIISVFISFMGAASTIGARPGNFTYNQKSFLLNGEPFQIIGGEMHPQRIPPEYWRARLKMARSMGLNTVFPYMFWNNVEPTPGQWNFTGRNDIARFVRTAQEEGLYITLRPGPYSCGEHDWGGFPAWLSQINGMQVRHNNQQFFSAAKQYLDRLGSELRHLQITQGGPILMVQLENEYGFFGNDKEYLQNLADILRNNFDVFLYTNDGGSKSALDGGQLHGVLAETDGDPRAGFQARDAYVSDNSSLGPLLDGEYYTTWIDNWGSNLTHHTMTGNDAAMDKVISDLEWILDGNNSFNLYLFHGGTNWGFDSGASADNPTLAVTTSYDYGAPLDESGRPTELYHRIRNMLVQRAPRGSIPEVPELPPMTRIDEFSLFPALELFESLHASPSNVSPYPTTMESLGQSSGLVLYIYTATQDVRGELRIGDRPRDRTIVYVNSTRVGVVDGIYLTPNIVSVDLKKGDTLQLLVENLGRLDIGQGLLDQRKGIVGNVTANGTVLIGWSMYSLPLTSLPSSITSSNGLVIQDYSPMSLTTSPRDNGGPIFYKGSFRLPQDTNGGTPSRDTFLTIPSGIKGQVWVNGINHGRYWAIGPQQSIYVPGCYLQPYGQLNEVIVLELEPNDSTQNLFMEGIATREWFNKPDPDMV